MENFSIQRYLRQLGFEQTDWGCERIFRYYPNGKPSIIEQSNSVECVSYSVQFLYDDNVIRKQYEYYCFQSTVCQDTEGGYYKNIPKFNDKTKDGWNDLFKYLGWGLNI